MMTTDSQLDWTDPENVDATLRRHHDSLIRLSIDPLDNLLNARNFNAPAVQYHLSADFVTMQVTPNPRWTTQSRTELLRNVALHYSLNPEYHVTIRDEGVSAEIKGEGRKGVVWVPAAIRGYATGEEGRVVREWVLKMQWRRRKVEPGRRWMCERLVAISAAGGFIGEH